jgi:flagellar motor switch protein FliG
MNDRQSQIRKAAILVSSLEPATAKSLLSRMPDEQANEIIEIVSMLGTVETEEEEEVIDEFFRIGPLDPETRQVTNETEDLSYRDPKLSPPSQPERVPAYFDVRPSLRSLHAASGNSLAARLKDESPQTIAVVVSHLPPHQAADLLACLPGSLQAQIARRLVDLEETSPEILLEIERGLEGWLLEHERHQQRRTAGLVALQNILAAADPLAHDSLLTNLNRLDHRLARQVVVSQEHVYSFDDLGQLDDASLLVVFSNVGQDSLSAALMGAPQSMISRSLRILPAARAARLKRDLTQSGGLRIFDIEQAQQEIAEVASQLDLSGKLGKRIGRKLSLAG